MIHFNHLSWPAVMTAVFSFFELILTLGMTATSSNSWKDLNIDTNLASIITSHSHVAIASAGNTIYACNQWGFLFEINIDNGSHSIAKASKLGIGAQGIIIDNEFHVIGGSGNNKHLKWNRISKEFDVLHDLKEEVNWNKITHRQLVRIKNKVFAFGGYLGLLGYDDQVVVYDIAANKWHKGTFRLPMKMCSFGCTKVLNGQYVILFGGGTSTRMSTDDIWIYDVKNTTFTKSKIKCPRTGQYMAFTISDQRRNQMEVFGYVRSQWLTSQIDDHLFPPEYLIKIIGKYYLTEEIHLFYYHGGNSHWKIDVFAILS